MFNAGRYAHLYGTALRPRFHYPYPGRYRLSSRSFQTTRPASSHFLDICYSQTHSIITGLHTITGLPWVITLPLTAILIRSCLILPLSVYSHNVRRRYISVTHLLCAWRRPIETLVRSKYHEQGSQEHQRLQRLEFSLKRQELQKRFGVSRWALFLPLLQLPVWLVAVETIRKMCGTHEGLLGLMTKRFTGAEALANDGVLAAAIPPLIPVEESLAVEGALWFTNLLVPDPQLILPFLLSASIFASITVQRRQALAIRGDGALSKLGIRIDRILKLLALAVGPLTLSMPSAMLVYWISSTLLALLQTAVLDRFMKIDIPVRPCRPKTMMELDTADQPERQKEQ